jgi:hypothetical protein
VEQKLRPAFGKSRAIDFGKSRAIDFGKSRAIDFGKSRAIDFAPLFLKVELYKWSN